MPIRIRDLRATLGALAGGLLISATAAAEPARSSLESLLWPIPGSVRLDQAGSPVSAAQLADRIVVVSFVTTGCTITCVIRTRDLAATARALPGSLRGRVAFLALSLDPVRDDAPALRAFAEGLGLDPAQVALLGSDPDTAARQRAALRYPADRSEPPETVLVFDRVGQLAMSYGGDPLDRPRLARDLAELDRFAKGVGHPPTSTASPVL